MRLACPVCRADIPDSNVNMDRAIARCPACGDVFGFADQVPGALRGSRTRPAVPLPKRFKVSGPPLRIAFRWFSPAAFFFLFFTLFWNGILSVFLVQIVTSHSYGVLLFLSLHLAVGLFMTYRTLASFLNRTEVTVESGQLCVRHRPLPWPGSRQLPGHTLKQLWVRERISRGKNGTSVTYELQAERHQGKPLKLLSGLEQPEQAIFLEQQLEMHLGIQDQPVAGELARS
ncbi:MAG: hypothetical protein QM767_13035 [Anaeromyxobacter sp.]